MEEGEEEEEGEEGVEGEGEEGEGGGREDKEGGEEQGERKDIVTKKLKRNLKFDRKKGSKELTEAVKVVALQMVARLVNQAKELRSSMVKGKGYSMIM